MTRLQQRYKYDTDINLMIDIDGSGPIDPFVVMCRFGSQLENMNVTEIGHYSDGEIIVKGYNAPGKLIKDSYF